MPRSPSKASTAEAALKRRITYLFKLPCSLLQWHFNVLLLLSVSSQVASFGHILLLSQQTY